jgi:hypothetical protein
MVKSVRLLEGPVRLDRYPSRKRAGRPVPPRKAFLFALGLLMIAGAVAAGWFWKHRELTHPGAGPVQVNTTMTINSPMASKATSITATSAAITWATKRPLTSQVEYGPTSDYGLLSVFNSSLVTAHSVILNGLTSGVTYHYAVLSADREGQVIRSEDLTFATSQVTGIPVLSHPVVTDIKATSATVTWTTDKPSASQVEYGTTGAHSFLSAFNPTMVTSHSVILTGLTSGATYDATAMSTDSNGQVGKSANVAFTVSGHFETPVISLVNTGGITTNSATVSWTTDQPSATQVAYGLGTTYGSLSAFNPSLVTTHSMILTSLTPGTTYNFSALSSNSSGQVGASANFAFSTVAAPPVIKRVKAADVTGTSATITWTTDQPATTRVAYGTSVAYGSNSEASSSLVTAHSVTLHGLKPGTRYHSAAISANAAGMQNSSPTMIFSTPTK